MTINFNYDDKPGCLKIKLFKFVFNKFYRQQIKQIYKCIEFNIDSITIFNLTFPISEEVVEDSQEWEN